MSTDIAMVTRQYQVGNRQWLLSPPKYRPNVTCDITKWASSPTDQVQTVTINGNPTGGAFTLSFGGVLAEDPTYVPTLPYNASASAVAAAIANLPYYGPNEDLLYVGASNVTVTSATTPVVPTLSLGTATSGGTFTAGAEYWGITVLGPWGESALSNAVNATLSANQEQPLNWTTLPTGTTGVKVYRSTTSTFTSPALVTTLGAVTTYTDTGTAAAAGAPPANAPTVYSVTFAGLLAGANTPKLVATGAFTGGTSPAVATAITTAAQPGLTPNGYIASGTAIGKITATGMFGPYDPNASDGRQTVYGFIFDDLQAIRYDGSTAASIATGAVVNDAVISLSHLPVQAGPGSIDSNGQTALPAIRFEA